MKEYQWPYPCIDKAEFLAQIAFVEKILQKHGAEYIEDFFGKGEWTLNDGSHAYEKIQKHVWKRENLSDTELEQEIRYSLGIEKPL